MKSGFKGKKCGLSERTYWCRVYGRPIRVDEASIKVLCKRLAQLPSQVLLFYSHQYNAQGKNTLSYLRNL